MAPRSVCWRGGRSAPPPVSSGRRVLQPGQQRRGREQPDPRRRQLDRQRQAVQPGADRGHRRRVLGGQREVRAAPPARAARRAPPPASCAERAGGAATASVGQGQRRDRELLLARRGAATARLVTSTFRPGQAASSAATSGGGGQHLLEVVEHQEHLLRPETSASDSASGRRSLSARPSACGDRREDQIGVAERGQGDEEDAVREVDVQLRRGLRRQARLAGAARPGEGQQAHLRPQQESPHGLKLPLAPDDRAALGRDGRRARAG